ncbi:MAG: MarR family transcriptional regulator [Eubacteriales bacterium]|nr:MarR family transcriptional regulator [Eubacteriales bacterium]
MTDQEIRTLLNQVLKDLFFRILRIQEKYVSRSSNDTISRTEMHILEVIQDTSGATLTHIADTLGITKATASVSVTRLVEKNYIAKLRSDKDKRTSLLKLTEQGAFCCNKHKEFHDAMVESVLDRFGIKEYPDVLKSLQALRDFFYSFE